MNSRSPERYVNWLMSPRGMCRAGILIGLCVICPPAVSAGVWQDVTEHPLNWKESPWFGWFNKGNTEAGWAYHWQHGWIYLAGPEEDTLWIWDTEMGWVWTSRRWHPVFYRWENETWLWYQRGTREPRKFQDIITGAMSYFGRTQPASTTTSFETASGTSAVSVPVLVVLGDGSAVEIPPLAGAVGVTIERESAPADPGVAGWQFSGPQRSLLIDIEGAYDVEAMRPLIVFPAASAGSLDPATLTVLRIETRTLTDGGTTELRETLPIQIRPDGSFVVRDFLMPDSLASARAAATGGLPALSAKAAGSSDAAGRKRVRYLPCTFTGSLNWTRRGELIQMLPDPTGPNYRIPLRELAESIQEHEKRKYVHNVVVLVHGHNEEEKDGIERYSAQEPWLFSYKRDVWNLLYQAFWDNRYFLGAEEEPWGIDLREVTRFYEFVYPTYRGVFDDLDYQLANELQRELAPLAAKGIPFNLVIVAHSMGGLVARAAVQRVSSDLEENFKKLITWGTPHLGSPLVSLRYVLAADEPYDFNFDDASAQTILASLGFYSDWSGNFGPVLKRLIRELASQAQMDAPGTRDLRYVRRPAQETTFRLALDRLFRLSASQQANETMLQRYDLQNGNLIYNFNLTHLNQGDRFTLSDKFLPLFGISWRRVELQATDSFPWFTVSNYDIQTAWGATLMPMLVADAEEIVPYNANPLYTLGRAGQSDGAVNVPSMVAHGVAKWAGGITGDHEEYFGAPDAAGAYANERVGKSNASFTIRRMFGGEEDPNFAYDRLGILYPPYLTPSFNMAYQIAWDGYKNTYDIGYADELTPLIQIEAMDSVEPLADNPHQYFKAYRLVANVYGPLDQRKEFILQDMRPVSFEPAPIIGSSVHGGGTFDETWLMGSLTIEDESLFNQWLYLELEALDGSRLLSPVPLKLVRRSPEGTWKIRLFLNNNEDGLMRFAKYYNQFPIDLDAAGLGETPVHDEQVTGGFDGNGIGTLETVQLDGTLDTRIRNNRLEFYAEFTQTTVKEVRTLIKVNNVDTFQTTIESVTLAAEFTFDSYLVAWTDAAYFDFYSDPQYQEIRSGWAANYRKLRSLDGLVVEDISEQRDGGLYTDFELMQPAD